MDHLHLQQQQFVKGFSPFDYNVSSNDNFDNMMNNYQNVVQQQQQISASSGTSNSSLEDDEMMSGNISSEGGGEDLRRGPWTVEEDFTLINHIARHGEGRWNSLARCAGLKRTGKSCRLRWLNYLRPDVRRGNITLEEQLLILELHSRWGNRWSKIAQHLPGRTDNEIKNYWRTRVQKHAKQLKCDVNSKQFKDTMRYLWMPRLVERIQAAAASSATSSSATTVNPNSNYVNTYQLNAQTATTMTMTTMPIAAINNTTSYSAAAASGGFTPENSSTTGGAASSDSFATQFSPISDLTDCYNNYPPAINQGNGITTTNTPPPPQDYNYYHGGVPTALISPTAAYFQGLDMQINGDNNNNNINVSSWMTMMDGGDLSTDNLWNVDDSWFLQ